MEVGYVIADDNENVNFQFHIRGVRLYDIDFDAQSLDDDAPFFKFHSPIIFITQAVMFAYCRWDLLC